jgi:hypothetical protein
MLGSTRQGTLLGIPRDFVKAQGRPSLGFVGSDAHFFFRDLW